MKARESELWTWLSKLQSPELHIQRIEDSLAAGVPDVELCIAGACGWLELKTGMYPVNADTPIRFPVRPEQVEWMNARGKAGGSAGWLLLVSQRLLWKKIIGQRRVFLLPSWHGASILEGLNGAELAARCVLQAQTQQAVLYGLIKDCRRDV